MCFYCSLEAFCLHCEKWGLHSIFIRHWITHAHFHWPSLTLYPPHSRERMSFLERECAKKSFWANLTCWTPSVIYEECTCPSRNLHPHLIHTLALASCALALLGTVGSLRNYLSLPFRILPVSKLDLVKHDEFLLDLARFPESLHSLLGISQPLEESYNLALTTLWPSLSTTGHILER